MSVSQNYSAISPSLSLDFAAVQALDPRITFSRATTATYYGTRTVKAEENLLLWSQNQTQTIWNKGLIKNITVTSNFYTAPDGTTTAAKLTFADGDGIYLLRNDSAGIVLGVQYVMSAWIEIKSGSVTALNVDCNNGTKIDVTSQLSAGTLVRVVQLVTAGPSTSVADWEFTATNGTEVAFWGAQVEQRSTVTAYTPTTTQPITNYIPVLETAASGVARFDHNPTTFESLGLLVEQQSTNLLTYSQEFDNAAWTKSNATVTANTIVSPDGTLDANKLIVDAGVAFNSGLTRQTVSKAASATTYTSTVYAKAGEFNRVRIYCRDAASSANAASVTISLVDGSVVVAAVAAGTFTTASSSTTFVGNGWYRINLTFTSGTETAIWGGSYIPSDSVATQGNGFNGIYIWGAQLEALAFPTSYIPTVASQVTRAADSASMTGTNFTSWYNAAEGTIYTETQTLPNNTTGAYFLGIGNVGSTNNYILMRRNVGGEMRVQVNGATVVGGTAGLPYTAGAINKVVGAYKFNDSAFLSNGGTPQTDIDCAVPSGLDYVGIGQMPWGVWLNGTIKKIAYYPLRLSNTNLQALTS
jgi:hypothetical protein